MSAHACCSLSAARGSARQGRASTGDRKSVVRAGKLSAWIGPSAVLMLLPKCPMCLAAYLALAGVGISAQAAAGLRVAIIASCVVALGLVAIKSFAKVLG